MPPPRARRNLTIPDDFPPDQELPPPDESSYFIRTKARGRWRELWLPEMATVPADPVAKACVTVEVSGFR
ncbi:MAG: hypothetical protein J0M04_13780 [Verrucomicrobia bacterium]|nr:hypothetical protein [Verrucomicrobiota bacterium]